VNSACRLIERSKDAHDLDETHGTVDSDTFLAYVINDLVPVLGNFERGEPNSVVLMDNATTHTDPEVRRVIEAAGALLVYTPVCSPDLIYIEYDFRMYKSYLRRHFQEARDNLMQVHINAPACVTYKDQCRIFNHIGCFQNVPSFSEGKKTATLVAPVAASIVAALVANKRLKHK
jgi:transposase